LTKTSGEYTALLSKQKGKLTQQTSFKLKPWEYRVYVQ